MGILTVLWGIKGGFWTKIAIFQVFDMGNRKSAIYEKMSVSVLGDFGWFLAVLLAGLA